MSHYLHDYCEDVEHSYREWFSSWASEYTLRKQHQLKIQERLYAVVYERFSRLVCP